MLDRDGGERVRIELREHAGSEGGGAVTAVGAWLTASDCGSAVNLIAGLDGRGAVEVCNGDSDLKAACLLETSGEDGSQARLALSDESVRAQWRVGSGEVGFDTARRLL